MKKLILLASSLLVLTNVDAQQSLFNDDMEAHPLGSLFNGRWSNWTQTSDPNLNLIISDDQAASGTKSGYIGPNNGNNGQDAFLKMIQTHNSGTITIEWKMFIPDSTFAYFNLQETNTPGESWGFECSANFYNADSDTLGDGYSLKKHICWTFVQDSTNYLHSYAPVPTDEWFTVKQVVNYDSKKVNFYVNDVEVTYTAVTNDDYPGTMGSFGGMNFYSREAHTTTAMENTYYIDDVSIIKTTVGINEINAANALVNVYPNPVTNNILNINAEEKISKVSIINIVGQEVLATEPNNNNTTVNTEHFAAGIYTAIIDMNGKKAVKEFVVK